MDAKREVSASLRASVEKALQGIKDTATGKGLIEARLASGIVVKDDGRVAFMIEIPPGRAGEGETLRQSAEAAVAALPGVTRVTAVLTAHNAPGGAIPAPQPSKLNVERRHGHDHAHGHDHGHAHAPAPGQGQGPAKPRGGVRLSSEAVAGATPQPAQALSPPPGIKTIVAVASAKGGVGKSTVAVNLAVAMARLGKRVGILDADIYGPSVPRLLGLTGAEPKKTRGGKIAPMEAWGVRAMSIGFLVEDDAPLVWRGPIVTGALMQLVNDVDWAGADSLESAPLDILVLDLPPGTGDIQLTLVQRIALAGVVIVSTPQEVALADVRRGVAMFRKTATPILGVVENMAWFEDSNGQRVHLFGKGGAERTAAENNVPFLGALPLIPALGENSDAGRPLAAAEPDGPAGRYFEALALKVLDGLEKGGGGKPPPKISFVD